MIQIFLIAINGSVLLQQKSSGMIFFLDET